MVLKCPIHTPHRVSLTLSSCLCNHYLLVLSEFAGASVVIIEKKIYIYILMAKCHAAKKEVVVVVFHCSGCIDGEDLK